MTLSSLSAFDKLGCRGALEFVRAYIAFTAFCVSHSFRGLRKCISPEMFSRSADDSLLYSLQEASHMCLQHSHSFRFKGLRGFGGLDLLQLILYSTTRKSITPGDDRAITPTFNNNIARCLHLLHIVEPILNSATVTAICSIASAKARSRWIHCREWQQMRIERLGSPAHS